MTENIRNSKKLATILPIALLTITALSLVPVAHAYGSGANWQAGFAGTFIAAPPANLGFTGSGGFWGWCAFGGGTGSPATSGTNADCEVYLYGYSPGGGSNNFGVHESIDGTFWDNETSPFTGLGDFFITTGTMTVTGPTVVHALQAGVGGTLPPFCQVSGNSVTCPLSFWETLGIYGPDTGIACIKGGYHMSFISHLFGQPAEIQIQLAQLS